MKEKLGHCFKFIKGTCNDGDKCAFMHVDADVVKEFERAKKAKAEAKAKAKTKAKAKAAGASRQSTLNDFMPSDFQSSE